MEGGAPATPASQSDAPLTLSRGAIKATAPLVRSDGTVFFAQICDYLAFMPSANASLIARVNLRHAEG